LNAINTVIKEMAWSRNCGMIIWEADTILLEQFSVNSQRKNIVATYSMQWPWLLETNYLGFLGDSKSIVTVFMVKICCSRFYCQNFECLMKVPILMQRYIIRNSKTLCHYSNTSPKKLRFSTSALDICNKSLQCNHSGHWQKSQSKSWGLQVACTAGGSSTRCTTSTSSASASGSAGPRRRSSVRYTRTRAATRTRTGASSNCAISTSATSRRCVVRRSWSCSATRSSGVWAASAETWRSRRALASWEAAWVGFRNVSLQGVTGSAIDVEGAGASLSSRTCADAAVLVRAVRAVVWCGVDDAVEDIVPRLDAGFYLNCVSERFFSGGFKETYGLLDQ
jgi:hypothetical protein